MRLRLGVGGRRVFVAMAAFGLVVGLGLAGSRATALAKGSSGSVLVVRVGGLPRHVSPRVRVTGPRGFSGVVRSSTQRFSGLAPGRYVLVISPTHGLGVIWSAGRVKRVSVKVGKGVRRATVAYTIGVRDNAKAVAGRQVLSATPAAGGGGTIVLTKKGAAGLTRGGYVVVGITRATPKGFLGHITSIAPDGSGVKVKAEPAGIGDVLPEADFEIQIPAKHVATSGFDRSSRRGAGRDRSAFLDGVTCSDGASLNLSGDASASIAATIHVIHHLSLIHPQFGVRLEADADESASVTASLSGSASCTLSDTQIGPDIPLGTYPIDVLGFPFTASPVLEFSISGDASASAAETASASESAHADAGIQWVNGSVSPFANFTHQSSFQPPTYTGNASLDGAVKAQVTIGIDETELGPDFAIENGLTFNADTTANPCWTLDDDLSATAGLDLKDLVTIPDYTVYQHTFPLAQSTESCAPASVTVTNPGDQTTPVGTAINLPITATDSANNTLTYAATGLPAGLTINPTTGVITGTPTTSGVNQVTITADDSTGASGQTSFTWTINVRWTGTITYDDDYHFASSSPSGSHNIASHYRWTVGVATDPADTAGNPMPFIYTNPSLTDTYSEFIDDQGCSDSQTYQPDSGPPTILTNNYPGSVDISSDAGTYQLTFPDVEQPGVFSYMFSPDSSGTTCPASGSSPTDTQFMESAAHALLPTQTIGTDPTHLSGSVTYTNSDQDSHSTVTYSWDLHSDGNG